MSWPTDKQLRDLGIHINCPDCGEFLWKQHIEGVGEWLGECPECGWPQPDLIVPDQVAS